MKRLCSDNTPACACQAEYAERNSVCQYPEIGQTIYGQTIIDLTDSRYDRFATIEEAYEDESNWAKSVTYYDIVGVNGGNIYGAFYCRDPYDYCLSRTGSTSTDVNPVYGSKYGCDTPWTNSAFIMCVACHLTTAAPTTTVAPACDCIGRYIQKQDVCYLSDGEYHPIEPLPERFDRLATVKEARQSKNDWKQNLGKFDSAGINGGSVHYRGRINDFGPNGQNGLECNGYGAFIMCMACT